MVVIRGRRERNRIRAEHNGYAAMCNERGTYLLGSSNFRQLGSQASDSFGNSLKAAAALTLSSARRVDFAARLKLWPRTLNNCADNIINVSIVGDACDCDCDCDGDGGCNQMIVFAARTAAAKVFGLRSSRIRVDLYCSRVAPPCAHKCPLILVMLATTTTRDKHL